MVFFMLKTAPKGVVNPMFFSTISQMTPAPKFFHLRYPSTANVNSENLRKISGIHHRTTSKEKLVLKQIKMGAHQGHI